MTDRFVHRTLDESPALDQKAWRAHWILSTVWLAFTAIPLAHLWWSDDVNDVRKVIATVLIAVFAVVYTLGFRVVAQRDVLGDAAQAGALSTGQTLWLLIGITAAALFLGGWAMIGLVPFVSAFACFTLTWRWTLIVAALSHLVVVVLPLAAGVYHDVWPITPAVTVVYLATILMRLTHERESERTMWHTELLLSEDRNRVARDVHDVLGHSLTAVVMKVELAKRLLDRLDPDDEQDRAILDRCRSELDELQTLSRRSLSEIRSTVGGLRHPTLPNEVTVARSLLADSGVDCSVLGDTTAVARDAQATLAWVVRESAANIVRHAGANQCTIALGPDPRVLLRIDDDGVGPGDLRAGNGICGLRERVAAIDATLSIGPRTPRGTRVEVRRA